MNEIPTPVTMGILSQCHQKTHEVDFSDLAKMTECSQDLERRLTIAREALEIARVGMSCVGVPNAAEREVLNDAFDHVCEALKQTSP